MVRGVRCLPESVGAKRVRVRIREKEGFKHPQVLRAPCYQVPKTEACTLGTLTCRWLRGAMVERRFLCFVSFSPVEKEMTCRHAQWLTVIKKTSNI
jgi:hypothetical protein